MTLYFKPQMALAVSCQGFSSTVSKSWSHMYFFHSFPSLRLQGLTGHSHTFRELMRSSSAVFQWETRWLLVTFPVIFLSKCPQEFWLGKTWEYLVSEGNLFPATPAMQGVHVVHNGVFQYLCGGFLDRLRILREKKTVPSFGIAMVWVKIVLYSSMMFNDVQCILSTLLAHM